MPAATEVRASVQVTATRAEIRSTDSSLRVMGPLNTGDQRAAMTRRDQARQDPRGTSRAERPQASSRRSTG